MNKNNTQTAVEWLQDKIKETYDKEGKLPLAYILDLVRQAKEMEKEQIIKAVRTGHQYCEDGFVSWIGEQYYNETYGEGYTIKNY